MFTPSMKKYNVNLVNGQMETVQAEICTYDQVGNLVFMTQRKTIATQENPEGITLELVKCYNQKHYVSFNPAPTIQ